MDEPGKISLKKTFILHLLNISLINRLFPSTTYRRTIIKCTTGQ